MTRLRREVARLIPVGVVLLFLAWWVPAFFSSYWLRTLQQRSCTRWRHSASGSCTAGSAW